MHHKQGYCWLRLPGSHHKLEARTWKREGTTLCFSFHIHSTREIVSTATITQHSAPSVPAGAGPRTRGRRQHPRTPSLPPDPLYTWALHPWVKQLWVINSTQDPRAVRARNAEPQMPVEGTLTVNWWQTVDKPRIGGVMLRCVCALHQRPHSPEGSCFSCSPGDCLGLTSSLHGLSHFLFLLF